MVDLNENFEPIRNLSYLESQEPDELSQANALNAIDKLLLLEETDDYTNTFHQNYNGKNKITENLNSAPNLSAKVAKYLSKSNKVSKMGAFDWINTPQEEEREVEIENYVSYDVGPMTQMAAEAIQELFNVPPISPIKENNNFMKRERENCVFRHPKRRRSNVARTLRPLVWHDVARSGTNTNRLPLILENVKRKKRSPLSRRSRGKIGNFGDVKGVKYEENDKRRRRERNLNERRRKRGWSGIRVLFSQNLELKIVKQQKKILSRFGVPIAPSIQDATHFVADRFARTKNMLEAISMGRHVATPDWLETCAENGCFVNEEKFILKDVKKEREIGFCLADSVKCARKNPLLEGWRVLVTQKVRPDKELVKCLVKASNGQLVERISRYTIEDEENLQGNLFVISCKEDYRICMPLLKRGIKVYDSELLLNGIVIQRLEFERYRLFAGKR